MSGPLVSAIINKRYDAAEMLIEHGANVNCMVSNDPIVCWCAWNLTEIGCALVKLLVNNGADVNSTSIGGYPLIYHLAHSVEMLNWIIQRGANVNLQCREGRPIHLLIDSYRRTPDALCEAVAILLANGADVNSKDTLGRSPIWLAARHYTPQYDSLIKLLIEAGADINDRYDGNTLLIRVIGSRNISLVNLLIELGADINLKGHEGRTPLHEASRLKQLTIVDLLIKKGALTNVRCDRGYTPFSMACYYRVIYKDIVDYLSTIPGIE
jgi:ankyrin repeat protein